MKNSSKAKIVYNNHKLLMTYTGIYFMMFALNDLSLISQKSVIYKIKWQKSPDAKYKVKYICITYTCILPIPPLLNVQLVKNVLVM